MLLKFPFLTRFFSKLLYELVPAAIASVVGGMLFSYYSHPSIAVPAASVGTPASAEMMHMVRDEHALIVSYLQKYNDVRQQTDLAAEQEVLRAKAAERAAVLAASHAREAETRALTAIAAKPARKVAVIRLAQELNKAAVGEPLQLVHFASVATQIQPFVPPTAPPATLVTHAARSDENVVRAKFREVTAMMERVPLWVHSVTEWFSGDVPSHRVLQLRTGIS